MAQGCRSKKAFWIGYLKSDEETFPVRSSVKRHALTPLGERKRVAKIKLFLFLLLVCSSEAVSLVEEYCNCLPATQLFRPSV
jgi:hypothetical protein